MALTRRMALKGAVASAVVLTKEHVARAWSPALAGGSVVGGITSSVNMPLGGGGFNGGLSVAPADGTGRVMVQTDSSGTYLGNSAPGTVWTQLNTPALMPAAYKGSPFIGAGSCGTHISRGNSNNMYMMYCPVSANFLGQPPTWALGALLKSTNAGVSWTQTGLISGYLANNYNPPRLNGQQIIEDPNNANIVWANTCPTSGGAALYVSVNGGTSFSVVGGLPAGFACGLAYDTTGGTTGGSTNRLLCAVQGSGLYVTTTAYNGSSSTWSLISSSSTTIQYGKIGSDGTYYYSEAAGDGLWRVSTGNTLTKVESSFTYNFAIDPNNPARVVVMNNGGGLQLCTSAVNTGTPTWASHQNGVNCIGTDSPWLAAQLNSSHDGFIDTGDLEFDPWSTTSTSSMTISSSGTASFTDAQGGGNSHHLTVGSIVRIQVTGTPTTYMLGTVATYNNGTGATTVTLGYTTVGYLGAASGGSGTHTTWTICMERVMYGGGFGFYTQNGFTTNITFTTQSAGIENFDGLRIIWPWTLSQGSGNPIVIVNDATALAITSQPAGTTTGTSLTPVPDIYGSVVEGTYADHSKSDKTFIVLGSDNFCGYATNGGATIASWTAFSTQPPNGGGGCVACYSSSNFVVAGQNGKLYHCTSAYTSPSWTAVASPIPASGWGGAFVLGNTVTVDWVDGTYIAVSSPNVYTWTVPGTVTQYSSVVSLTNYVIIASVPNQQGHVFVCDGSPSFIGGTPGNLATFIADNGASPNGTAFSFSSNHGQTWTSLPNVENVYAFGYTAPASGQTYPTIRFWGYVKILGTYTFGLYRIDGFNPSNIAATTYVNENIINPKGWFTEPVYMCGDMGQWGRTITACGGGGFSLEQISGQTNSWP